jgi:hydroxymethylbilane synthase
LKYIIGTRGSHLSLAQTNWIISELKKQNSENEYEIKTIKTKGDIDVRPLFSLEQKGIFEREIDRAVAKKEVDFAVHSLKDVPSDLADGLVLSSIPKREPINDVFISNDDSTLETIKSGAVIGTSSLRRAVQISRLRDDVIVKPIRGNIESRIQKIKEENYDGVVLAQAGINRLGLDVKFSKLSVTDFPPSPGQGALGIVCRSDDVETISMLKKIENSESRLEIEAERALSNFVESGCRFPVGAFAQVNEQSLKLTVAAYSVDGKQALIVEKTGNKTNPLEIGKLAGEELQKQGIKELALNWREKLDEWNKK